MRTSLISGSLGLALLALLAVARPVSAQENAEQVAEFNRDIGPILVRRCLECHGARDPSGGLSLTDLRAMQRGGDSGPVLDAEHSNDSPLLERVVAGEMPPPRQGQSQRLPADEIKRLRQWVQAGAPWPADRTLDLYEATSEIRGGRDWWSLRPVVPPAVPRVQAADLVATPLDAFVLAELEARDLQPAPIADGRTLIRRLYYDVIGLPPTHEEIEAFVANPSDEAWRQLVDHLLDSPQYGERWARYWLDLARYAETSGYERDQTKPFTWKYRDWVVNAFNDDMPYNRFIVEQLAGDELPERDELTVIATGFLRLGTWNDEPNDPQDYKYERLEDLVHATSSAFLGMTVKCARCHDHKFDPIPQEDYYRLASAFWPGPIEPRGRELLGGPTADELGHAETLGWTDVTASPPPLHVLKAGDRHQPLQPIVPASLSFVPASFRPFAPPAEGARTSQRRLQLARWIASPDNPLTARVMVNRLWQHHFGQGLVRSPNNFGFRGDPPTHPELLDWLADRLVRENWQLKPLHRLMLTSRVYRQSSNHPRHEEYARIDFENRLWWRAQRRRLDAEALRDSMLKVSGQLDPRAGGPSFLPSISAEALEGLSRKAAAWQASPDEAQRRRSVYMFVQRSLLPPWMTTFDFCDSTLPCGGRDVTTVAPQALALLNNPFSHQQSLALARRVAGPIEGAPPAQTQQTETQEAHTQKVPIQTAQIQTAWKLALGRLPTTEEVNAAAAHLLAQQARFQNSSPTPESADGDTTLDAELLALASLCHVLLNSNEFLYVD